MIDLAKAVDGKDGYLTYLAVMRAAKRSGQRMTAKAAKQVLQQAVDDNKATWFQHGTSVNVALSSAERSVSFVSTSLPDKPTKRPTKRSFQSKRRS